MAFRYIHENIFVVMGTWRGRHNWLLLAVFFHSKAACLLLYPILMMCTIIVVAPPTHGTVVQCVLCHAAPLEFSLVLAWMFWYHAHWPNGDLGLKNLLYLGLISPSIKVIPSENFNNNSRRERTRTHFGLGFYCISWFSWIKTTPSVKKHSKKASLKADHKVTKL